MSTAQALPLFITTSPAQEGLQGDSQWVIFCSSYIPYGPSAAGSHGHFPTPAFQARPAEQQEPIGRYGKLAPQSPPAARVPH